MPADRSTVRRQVVVLAVFGCLGLLMVGAPSAAAPAAPASPSRLGQDAGAGELKEQYDEAVAAEGALLDKLADAQAASSAASARLKELQTQSQDAKFQLLIAHDRLKEAEEELVERLAALREAERLVEKAQDRLRAQIVASYIAGGDDDSVLVAVLSAGNNEQVGQALAYGRAVSGSTDALVHRLDEARADQAKAEQRARASRTDARKAKDTIEQAASFLAEASRQQAALVQDLNFKVLAEADALRRVQGRKAIIEGRINAMSRASDGVAMILASVQRDQPEWVPGSVAPISTPVPGIPISSGYGLRQHPILGMARLHAGVDIGGATGTKIHASADGIVVIAEVRGGYGNTVVIDHGNSLATLYGHNSQLLVSAGQEVRYGDVIALMGSTGLSTGPHSHFETRVKGLPIDPTSVISDFGKDVDYEVDVDD